MSQTVSSTGTAPPGDSDRLGEYASRSMYWAIALVLRALMWIPPVIRLGLAERFGLLMYARNDTRARQLRANLRVVLGELADAGTIDRAARDVYANYTRYMLEAFTHGLPSVWRGEPTAEADPAYKELRARGKGAVLVGIHGANMDYCIAAIGRQNDGVHTAMEALRPAWLARLFAEARRRGGIQVHFPNEGARPMIRALRAGQLIGLVGERPVIGESVEAVLCGRRTRLPKGPVVLALITGAVLFTGYYGRRADGSYFTAPGREIDLTGLKLNDPDVALAVQRVADGLSDMLRMQHRSWFALQPIWPDVGPDPA